MATVSGVLDTVTTSHSRYQSLRREQARSGAAQLSRTAKQNRIRHVIVEMANRKHRRDPSLAMVLFDTGDRLAARKHHFIIRQLFVELP